MNTGLLAQVACILEATARKPGNVHRGADFAGDAHYLDFLLSAAAIAGPMNEARALGVGETVLACVKATREVVSTNTNLGMILLLVPFACVGDVEDLRTGVMEVLQGLTIEDAKAVYEAIRLAGAGGMGEVSDQDVRDDPTVTLLEAMKMASGYDAVARQYATGFEDVFAIVVPALLSASLLSKEGLRGVENDHEIRSDAESTPPSPPLEKGGRKSGKSEVVGESTPPSPPFQRGGINRTLESAIIQAFLVTLAARPDTLIARKRGDAIAAEASRRAAVALDTGNIDEFDAWLRADGHARNPGATADLVAAALFVALRNGTIRLSRQGHGWNGFFISH